MTRYNLLKSAKKRKTMMKVSKKNQSKSKLSKKLSQNLKYLLNSRPSKVNS